VEPRDAAARLAQKVSWAVLGFAFVKPVVDLTTFYLLRWYEHRLFLPSLISMTIFIVISCGIARHLRSVAWMGLLFYVIERIHAWHSYQKLDWIFTVGFTLIFIAGVRVTSALNGPLPKPDLNKGGSLS
jgi:uncharacterized membrane protein